MVGETNLKNVNSIKELPKLLLEKLKIKRFTSDLILEGGGVVF